MLTLKIIETNVPTGPWARAAVYSVRAVYVRRNLEETTHCGAYGTRADAERRAGAVEQAYRALTDARSVMPAARPAWADDVTPAPRA